MIEKYSYDVAFSFLQQDENLAVQLNSLLKGRVKTFIYLEQQKKLAGRDGEELFNRVFSKESRIVVVLYRNNWGKTSWTKIEETAIRNRGFEFGYDFVVFIPLDKPIDVPVWLPKNRLWIGLDRWGIEGAASIIDARIQEFGGDVKIETVTDKVQRAQEEIRQSQDRLRTLTSINGLELMHNEYNSLISEFKNQLEEIRLSLKEWHLKISNNDHHGIDIRSYGYYMTIHLYTDGSYTPQNSYVYMFFCEGVFDERGIRDPFAKYEELNIERVKFDINKQSEYGWSDKDTGENFRITSKIIDNWLSEFFDTIKKHRLKKNY